jgi:hypothetical protein
MRNGTKPAKPGNQSQGTNEVCGMVQVHGVVGWFAAETGEAHPKPILAQVLVRDDGGKLDVLHTTTGLAGAHVIADFDEAFLGTGTAPAVDEDGEIDQDDEEVERWNALASKLSARLWPRNKPSRRTREVKAEVLDADDDDDEDDNADD